MKPSKATLRRWIREVEAESIDPKPWYASHTDPPSDPTRAVELLIQLIKGGHPNDQLAGPHSEHEFATGEVTPQ